MPRVIVLGCGTGVGKTRVSVALLRELAGRSAPAVGLKPVESGYRPGGEGSDAFALAAAGSLRPRDPTPCYAFETALSPHLAARDANAVIDLVEIQEWVRSNEIALALPATSPSALWSVIETAGGVFSPLSDSKTNFDFARALEPSTWVLVAADALGVLHEVSATSQAMAACGRVPDHVLLCAAREPDASTGRNAAELERLGITRVSGVLARHDDQGIGALSQALLRALEPEPS